MSENSNTHNLCVILDRDGVINQDSEHFIKTPEEWIPIKNSLEAIALLNKMHIPVFIATNQSGIGRGLFTQETLFAMHQKMRSLLTPLKGDIQDIAFCPHTPNDSCTCRKPKTGLIQKLKDQHALTHKTLYLVGDAKRDLTAAINANCIPILVKTGKGQKTLDENKTFIQENQIKTFNDLYHFAQWLSEKYS